MAKMTNDPPSPGYGAAGEGRMSQEIRMSNVEFR
jgi:hypothetical protein